MTRKKYPRTLETPMATVDVVIFTIAEGKLQTLLIKRRYDPFKGAWALPGGFIRKNEELLSAAMRELKEETGVCGVYLEQLYTFGKRGRDPRGRVISVAYFALVPKQKMKLCASADALEARLFPVRSLPRLAFDHKAILEYALYRLRNKIQYTNAAWSLLPKAFTLGEIQRVYEIILDGKIDKRNFRKKILSLGLLRGLPKIKHGLRQRPAKLYEFKTTKHVELKRFF